LEKIYLLHGFMGTSETHFIHQKEHFTDAYEVELIDLPGHGASTLEAEEDYIEQTIVYIINEIKSKGRGYLLGLSLGASLAIHIALREPDLVKGIILTGYSPFIPEEFKEMMESQYHHFMNIEENDQDVARQFKELHGEKWKATMKNVLYKMTYHYPSVSEDEINGIKPSVLVLNGSNEMYEVESALYMKKYNPDISIGLIPGAGHTANIDQHEIYNRMVENFLQRMN
jgi:pimeloyl-ACP methyl ester carboxylesterase